MGQTHTELSYDELIDPQGKSFWPDDKGRDGCRTPMTWDAAAPNAGFSTANQTWLPIKKTQIAQSARLQADSAGSVLSFYREMLTLRRGSADLRLGRTRFLEAPAQILAFERGDRTLCLFNLSRETVTVDTGPVARVLASQAVDHPEAGTILGPDGFLIALRP